MSDAQDGEALIALLTAMTEVPGALADACSALAPAPDSVAEYAALAVPRRIAGIALLIAYPLPRRDQWGRLMREWHAADELMAISLGVVAYLKRLNIENQP